MDNALQQYLQLAKQNQQQQRSQGQIQNPDAANAPILDQNQQTNDDVNQKILQSQQLLDNALSQYKSGGTSNNPYAAYDPNLSAIGHQASLFGVPNAPITEVFGQRQPGIEVFSHGITNGTGFAMPVGTPLSLPKGQWNVLSAYSAANNKGHIGDGTNYGYGNSVLVENANTGEKLRFSHLSKVGVKQGQSVNGGIFALSGDTGNASGPHLNLEYYTPQGELGDVLHSTYAQSMTPQGNSNQAPRGGGNPLKSDAPVEDLDPVQRYARDMVNFIAPLGPMIGKGIDYAANGIQQGVQNLINPAPHYSQALPQANAQTVNPLTPTTAPRPTTAPTLPPATPTPTMSQPSPTPTPAMNPLTPQIQGVAPDVSQSFTTMLQKHIFPVTRKYGIPDSVVAAQAAQESGWMQKPAGSNNFFGLKAHSYPGFANFDTPEQGAEYYAQTIQALVPNLDKIKNKPLAVLQALQNGQSHYEGDNPDPMQYVYDVSNNPAWKAYNGGNPYPTNPHGWR